MLQNGSVFELPPNIIAVYCVGVFGHDGLVFTVEDSQQKGSTPEFSVEGQDFQELQNQLQDLRNAPGSYQFTIGQVLYSWKFSEVKSFAIFLNISNSAK